MTRMRQVGEGIAALAVVVSVVFVGVENNPPIEDYLFEDGVDPACA